MAIPRRPALSIHWFSKIQMPKNPWRWSRPRFSYWKMRRRLSSNIAL